jgi:hypothetical protein
MTAEESEAYRYDAFISYSHRDKEWVRGWLLPRLEAAGLRVCIDFRDFEPGARILTEMERAVVQSRKTLLVLTPDYLASEWAKFENILASTLDPAARQRRVIPLLLKQCELPLRIRSLIYLDFTQPSEAELQLQRLVAAIGGEPIRHTPLPPTPPPAERAQLPLVEIVTHFGQRVREWLIKTLRDPLWQGIGGAIAVLALLVAIGTWLWPDIRYLVYPERPTAAIPVTWTPGPTDGSEVVIEVDGLVRDAGDDRCQEVVCQSSLIIEAKVLDLTRVRLQPDDFSYNWRFDPPDPRNLDRLESKIYAIIYSVPCDRDSQMVTIEVLRNGRTLGVRAICFDIERPP